MRILLEPGSYSCMNMGDVAMMQVAARRIRALCPNAEIDMFTSDSARLARYCPEVRPVEANARTALLPGRVEWGLRRRSPGWVLSGLDRWRKRKRGGPLAGFVRECSLVAVCGMGGLTDAFARHAWTISSATRDRKSVV